jgi:cell division protein FtsI (penicillin-binding protein 3)
MKMQSEPNEETGNGSERPGGDGFQLLAKRSQTALTLFLLMLLAVFGRLVTWKVWGPPPRTAWAKNDVPQRGRIVDRNGLLLATDDYVGDLYVNPHGIAASKDKAAPQFPMTLTLAFKLPEAQVKAVLAGDTEVAILSKGIPIQQCNATSQIGLGNLAWCDRRTIRSYPQGALAAHVIGFTNEKHEGYGVEISYDDWLRTDGDFKHENLPAQVEPIPESWRLYLPSPANRDLVLHLDAPLQHVVETALKQAVIDNQADSGSIIILNPKTGAILAMANYPAFDLQHIDASPVNLWKNASVIDTYEPGSVFKLVTMAAGIDTQSITPDSRFVDEGMMSFGPVKPIYNAENKVYGNITVRDALARSVNVVSAKVSLQLGAQVFYQYVSRFGFGKVTEVDLRSEAKGYVNESYGDVPYQRSNVARNSFGQGIAVTGLQMISAVSAIANKGVQMQPAMVKGLAADGQIHLIPPRALRRPISAESAKAMTEMMIYTVEQSSNAHPVPGYRVAGKTGTAEIPKETGYTETESITSFIGFLPAADPQIVMMVKIDRPRRYAWAEQVTVPVFAEVAQQAVQILEIKPDDRMP